MRETVKGRSKRVGEAEPLIIDGDDGSKTNVRDELKRQRILRALRGPGPLLVHVLPREDAGPAGHDAEKEDVS